MILYDFSLCFAYKSVENMMFSDLKSCDSLVLGHEDPSHGALRGGGAAALGLAGR